MVKYHSDREREETCCRHMGYSFRLAARVLLYAPSHRQDSTYHGLCYTSRGALAGTRNSLMGPPHEGSIRRPIAPWVNALTIILHPTNSSQQEEMWQNVISIGIPKHLHLSTRNPLSYFLFLTVLHDWCNKGCGMCYPVCGMVHIKGPLLLIRNLLPPHGLLFPISSKGSFICTIPQTG